MATPEPTMHRSASANKSGLSMLMSAAKTPEESVHDQMHSLPALTHEVDEAERGALNEHLENELPGSYNCSPKVDIDASDPRFKDEAVRGAAITAFMWRRLCFDGQWVVVPSLAPPEVEFLDSAIREKIKQTGRVDAPESAFGTAKFDVAAPESEEVRAPLAVFQWWRLFCGTKWILVPSLREPEVKILSGEIISRFSQQGSPPTLGAATAEVAAMIDDMSRLKALASAHSEHTYRKDDALRRVALIIVVEAEVKTILQRYQFEDDEELNRSFMTLGRVRSAQVGSYRLYVIKAAESPIFHRHYSGYTQAAAIAAVTSSVLRPELTISFGTAGGVPGRARIGDTVLATGCLYIDRLRTRNKNAFDWGVWGGCCTGCERMAEELGLVRGIVASQIGYTVTDMQSRLIDKAGIYCLDMEAAPIAEIMNQTQHNMIALKVISNGVYPGEPRKMEAEYHDYREEVSRRATEVLQKVLEFFRDRKVSDL